MLFVSNTTESSNTLALFPLTCKPSILQVLLILNHLTSTRNASNIHGYVIPQLLGQGLLSQDVGDGDATARLEHAVHLLEHLMLVRLGHQVDYAVGDDAVGRVILERDSCDNALDEADVVCVILPAGLDRVGSGKHVIVHIDTDRPTGWADAGSSEEDVEASAATEVNDSLALSMVCISKGAV